MKFRSFILIAIFAPTLLLAQEEVRHIGIGTRPISAEATAQIEADKIKQAEKGEKMICGFIFDRYPPIYFSNSHYWLEAIHLQDSNKYALQFQDGSHWLINPYDNQKALNWHINDPLTITQNNRWFSTYPYRIINKATGASIEAKLFRGPYENGAYTRYIISIDPAHAEIMLSDTTHWEISYFDTVISRDWAVTDAIIIGTNSGWDSDSEALLINVNMNTCARAKQF